MIGFRNVPRSATALVAAAFMAIASTGSAGPPPAPLDLDPSFAGDGALNEAPTHGLARSPTKLVMPTSMNPGKRP